MTRSNAVALTLFLGLTFISLGHSKPFSLLVEPRYSESPPNRLGLNAFTIEALPESLRSKVLFTTTYDNATLLTIQPEDYLPIALALSSKTSFSITKKVANPFDVLQLSGKADNLSKIANKRLQRIKSSPAILNTQITESLAPQAISTKLDSPGPAGSSPLAREISLQVAPGETVQFSDTTSNEDRMHGIWTGISDYDNSSVRLAANKGMITGTIRRKGSVVSIRPLDSKHHVLITKDLSKTPPEHSIESIPVSTTTSVSDEFPSPNSDTPIVISLLVAYTRSDNEKHKTAEAYVADVPSFVKEAVSQSNASLVASGVSNVRFSLTEVLPIDYSEEGEFSEHLERFADPNDDYMDLVHAYRDVIKADACILLVGDDRHCGEAKRINASADEAFAIVSQDCANSVYSFAHELAHIFGARHDLSNDSTMTPHAHSHGHLHKEPPAESWRTIMAYRDQCPGDCDRIPYWSSATKKYKGLPLGNPITADNARTLSESAYRVSLFR